MENDEITLDTQEEQKEGEPEVVEETTTMETTEKVEVPKDDSVKLSPAEYRHFKKWQSEGKPTVKKADTSQPASLQPSVEETVLLANGMPEDLLSELKAVASVRNVSLIKAQNDPIFVAVKEKFEKDQKQKDANLPASRGSGSVKPKKDFTTPGLTREDHMKMVKETR